MKNRITLDGKTTYYHLQTRVPYRLLDGLQIDQHWAGEVLEYEEVVPLPENPDYWDWVEGLQVA